ncbi:hypothetical protein ABK040_005672 [Willaertia magna]
MISGKEMSPSFPTLLHCGYLYVANAVPVKVNNNIPTNNNNNTIESDSNNLNNNGMMENLDFKQKRWFEVYSDYHLYQFQKKINRQQQLNNNRIEGYEFKTNLLEYQHIIPINYSPLSSNNIEEVQQQQQTNSLIDHKSDNWIQQQMNEDEDENNLNSKKKFMFCCKSNSHQEILLLCTNSEMKRSVWIAILKHVLLLSLTMNDNFIENNLLDHRDSHYDNKLKEKEGLKETLASNMIAISYIHYFPSSVLLFTEKVSNSGLDGLEKEEGKDVGGNDDALLLLAIAKRMKESTQYYLDHQQQQQQLENNQLIQKDLKEDDDDPFTESNIDDDREIIENEKINLLKEKVLLLDRWINERNNNINKTTDNNKKELSKELMNTSLLEGIKLIEKELRSLSSLYFQQTIQFVKNRLLFEWRFLKCELQEVLKELLRIKIVNTQKLTLLFSQKFTLYTDKKIMKTKYSNLLNTLPIYSNTNNNNLLGNNNNNIVNLQLIELQQHKQELYLRLTKTSLKLRQVKYMTSLRLYQQQLIENFILKINCNLSLVRNYLHYGILSLDTISQLKLIEGIKKRRNNNMEEMLLISSSLDQIIPNNEIDISFFLYSASEIISQFKNKIEKNDSYVIQLTQAMEKISSEYRSQKLANSEERRRKVSIATHNLKDVLRHEITTNCTQISNPIHQFVHNFLNSDLKSTINHNIQQFLRTLADKVVVSVKTSLSWTHIYEVLEDILFQYYSYHRGMVMYDTCMQLVHQEVKLVDEAFYNRCTEVSTELLGQLLLDGKQLNLQHKSQQQILEEEITKFKSTYQKAIDMVQSLSEERYSKISKDKPFSPSAKLHILTKASREVMDKIYSSRTNDVISPSQIDEPVSTDDFLPVFICVICLAKLKDMFSQINFIKSYAFEDSLVGEDGFYFSSIESAACFILNFEPENENNTNSL